MTFTIEHVTFTSDQVTFTRDQVTLTSDQVTFTIEHMTFTREQVTFTIEYVTFTSDQVIHSCSIHHELTGDVPMEEFGHLLDGTVVEAHSLEAAGDVHLGSVARGGAYVTIK